VRKVSTILQVLRPCRTAVFPPPAPSRYHVICHPDSAPRKITCGRAKKINLTKKEKYFENRKISSIFA